MVNENKISKLMRKELQTFVPYNANQIAHKIKLDANESPFDIPESVRSKIADYILTRPNLNLYPDTELIAIKDAVAKKWQVTSTQVTAGNGSDQIIEFLVHAFAGAGDTVVAPKPSFGMYRITSLIAGANVEEIILGSENCFAYDTDLFINIVNRLSAKLLFLCTPNNPTGDVIPESHIIKIIKSCPDTIIVVDEAYAEFSGDTVIPYVNEYQNLIVLRTFSKAYGLAGIRCGYAVGSKEIIEVLERVRPPYNLNSLSQLIATMILENSIDTKLRIEYIVEQREALISELKDLPGLLVYPTKANFVLIDFGSGDNSSAVYEELLRHGILVRAFGKTGSLASCLRITVGTTEQNLMLVRVIKGMKLIK